MTKKQALHEMVCNSEKITHPELNCKYIYWDNQWQKIYSNAGIGVDLFEADHYEIYKPEPEIGQVCVVWNDESGYRELVVYTGNSIFKYGANIEGKRNNNNWEPIDINTLPPKTTAHLLKLQKQVLEEKEDE